MTCSAAGEKFFKYKTVYTKKLYLFEAPQAKFFGLMTQAPTFSHDSPPRYGGEFRAEFFMKKQGSEGIGGIFGFSADGDAPLRYGGDFWGFGGD
jgi:hypothetical protein